MFTAKKKKKKMLKNMNYKKSMKYTLWNNSGCSKCQEYESAWYRYIRLICLVCVLYMCVSMYVFIISVRTQRLLSYRVVFGQRINSHWCLFGNITLTGCKSRRLSLLVLLSQHTDVKETHQNLVLKWKKSAHWESRFHFTSFIWEHAK